MANLLAGRSDLGLELVAAADYDKWFSEQDEFTCNWLVHSGFKGAGHSLIPGPSGNPARVIVVSDNSNSYWALSSAAKTLPVAQYHFSGDEQQQTKCKGRQGLGAVEFLIARQKCHDLCGNSCNRIQWIGSQVCS